MYLSKLESAIDIIRQIFEIAGIITIIIGGIYTIYDYLKNLFLKNLKSRLLFIQFKFNMSRTVVMGLELIIAGDVINTIIAQSYQDIGMLMLIVIVRTLINFSMNKDLETITPEDRRALDKID